MKRILLLPILVFCALFYLRGQAVSGYSFAEGTETYAQITGTTSTATGDDGTQTNVPIGFSFTFGGVAYTAVGITTNGMIRLGTNATNTAIASGWVNSLGNAAALRPLITGFWDDNNLSTGTIRYTTTGSTPNQIFTVNWHNTKVGSTGSSGGAAVSTLVRLYETTNVIEIVYSNPFTTTNTVTASVGLNDMTSFLSVTPAATSTVSSATANNSINATVMANLAGKKLIFTPPIPPSCLAPTAPTVSTITATGANLSWTAPASAPSDGYEWEVRTSATPGGGTLAASGSTAAGITTATATGLTANTTYYLHVRSDCGSGEYSSWVVSSSFVTPCSSITAFPYTQDFEGTVDCWTTGYASGTSGPLWTIQTGSSGDIANSHTGAAYATKDYTTSDALIASPPFDFTAASNNGQVKVWLHRHASAHSTDVYRVYANTTPSLSGATQLLELFSRTSIAPTVAATGWYEYTIAVPPSFNTSSTVYLLFRGTTNQGFSSYDLGVDDFILEFPALCTGTPDGGTITGSLVRNTCPGSAPSPASITASGMTASAPDITYQWEESTNSGVDWANATGGTGATTTTYTPPVYAGTPILYRLKVTCTASGLSDVSDVEVSVTNPVAPATQASNISTSALGLNTATITWTNGNGGRRYVIINTSNSFTDPASTSDVTVAGTAYSGSGEQIVYDGTASTVSVTGLSPTTTYYVRVYEYLRCTGSPNINYYNITTATNNPGSFTTLTPPDCPGDLGAGTVMIGSLPYSATGQTNCGNGNNVTAANATVCGNGNYYGGEDKTYVFTPDVTGEHTITLTTTSTWTGLMLYEGCPFVGRGGTCVGNTQTSSGNKTLTVTLTSGMTYYLIVDSYPDPTCHPSYSLSIIAPCAGTPEAGTISGTLSRPTCPGVAPGSITATGFATGPGITYQWEQSINLGVDWVNVTGGTGATTTTYTPPVYAGTPILYRLNVTCTASGLSDFSDVEVSVTDPAVPTTPASNISTSTLGLTTATITWTNGNGGRRYVVINTSNSFTDPASTSDVTVAGTVYAGSGEQIVFDGTGSSVLVTGLTQGTTYYVRVYEYLRCTGTPNTNYYNTATATSNPGSFMTATPPSNNDCADAIPLTVTLDGTCSAPTMGTNVGATASGQTPTPSCGSFGAGQDIWYSVEVPASGAVTIEMKDAGGPTDWVMSVYSGACGSLVQVLCDDDGGDGAYPLVALTGRTPGETLLVRAFEYGSNSYGNVNICAHSFPCGSDDVTLVTTPGTYALDEPCEDGNGWTYYSRPGMAGEYMFAIEWDINSTGNNAAAKASAVVEVAVGSMTPAENGTIGASYGMGRYWNVTTSPAITDPVNVRFFYAAGEKADAEAAATGFANDNEVPNNGFSWFKTNSGAYTPGIITATDFQNSVLLLSPAASGFENTVPYVQFNGLASFSGGSGAAGAGAGFLPVQLLSFTAQATEAGNKLNWATASEENARHFAIERSTDGRSAWQTVGTVAAKGFSQSVQEYAFMDDKPTATAYYRLRMEDFDGSFEYSNIVYLQRSYKGSDMTVYPVPTSTEVQLGFVVDAASTATFTVTDMAGRTVMQLQRQLQSGLQNESLDVSQLPNGVYLVAVEVNGERFVQRMVKQ